VNVKRGEICVQATAEMKRVLYMTREDGRTIKEIRADNPDFFIWGMAESENLAEEDNQILLHPNQWGRGYPKLLLSKYFKVAKTTTRDSITAYNRSKKSN
jgi:tRNA pseudouridine-54 N-methylase